ncbi:MAG: pyruvate formate-lyase, partial [Clostridia bacterium]|nr:pyruvate formate-lyase [Clostridia bacterium]
MVKFDVEGAQNVEVSIKIPCEKSMPEQLEIMERYTATHKKYNRYSKERREVECLKVIFPTLLRTIEEQDLIAGRLDFLPIGFGTVTSVGGVGHYCVFNKLRAFQNEIGPEYSDRVETLYRYWLDYDLKTIYCKEVLTDTTIGRFIDVEYPLIATARLSGMMLDYPKLLDNGIDGLKKILQEKCTDGQDNEFCRCGIEALDIVAASAEYLKKQAQRLMEESSDEKRRKELQTIADNLEKIRSEKPKTFPEALQLFWLYAIMAGVINYGRLDDFLGPYLAKDLEEGRL